MAGGPLQAADDMVRIITNGMTFGGADKVATMLGEQDSAKKTAAARDRAGIAGDAASLLGLAGDLKIAGKAAGMIPTVAKTIFSKKGALAAAAGLGTLAEYNARTENPDALPAKAPAKAAKQPNIDDIVGKIADAVHGSVAQAGGTKAAPTFEDLVTRLAAGQDGNISLRQFGALSSAAQNGAQADYYSHGGSQKAPGPGDAAARMLEQMYTQKFAKALNDPNADSQKAADEFESKVLQLRKTQFIDPYGLQAGGE